MLQRHSKFIGAILHLLMVVTLSACPGFDPGDAMEMPLPRPGGIASTLNPSPSAEPRPSPSPDSSPSPTPSSSPNPSPSPDPISMPSPTPVPTLAPSPMISPSPSSAPPSGGLSLSHSPKVVFASKVVGGNDTVTLQVRNDGVAEATGLRAGEPLFKSPFGFAGGSYPGGGSCGTNLAVGDQCTIVLKFSPLEVGSFADRFILAHDAGSVSRDLEGTGLGIASLSLSDGNIFNFGGRPIGTSGSHLFTLTNNGSADATSLRPTNLEMPLPPPFNYTDFAFPGTGGDCGTTLAHGQSCTLSVTFAPTQTVLSNAAISVSFQDGLNSSPQAVTRAIKGTGNALTALTITSAPILDFGSKPAFSTSEATLTVTNTSPSLATALLSNDLNAPFSFKGGSYPGTGGNCGTELAAGASCNVVLLFSPVGVADFDGVFHLNFFDGAETVFSERQMTGKGISGAVLGIAEAPLYDFGKKATTSSNEYSLTISNSGPVPATAIAQGISLSAPFSYPGGFPGGGTCQANLNPDVSCTVKVRYSPTVDGPSDSEVRIAYHDGGTNRTVSTTVAGTGAGAAFLTLSEASFNFEQVVKGNSPVHEFILTNNGGVEATDLREGIPALTAPFSFEGGSFPGTRGTCGKNLKNGESCTIAVSFTPTTVDGSFGTFKVAYHDGLTQTFVAGDVEGSGSESALLTISDEPIFDFESKAQGSSNEHIFVLTNRPGGQPATLITQVGTVGSSFSMKAGDYPNKCTSTLNAGINCNLIVVFSPTAPGTVTGTLRIRYNNGSSTAPPDLARQMTGRGANGAELELSENAGESFSDFGPQIVGVTTTKKLTLKNIGEVTATAIQMGTTALIAPFSYNGGTGIFPGNGVSACQGTLAVNDSCFIYVNFFPLAAGAAVDGAVSVNYYDGVSTKAIERMIKGSGLAQTSALRITATEGDGSYKFGAPPLHIQVVFDRAVTVAGGIPTIQLNSGGSNQIATYSATSGDTLIFTYAITATDDVARLDVVGAITLNGATIKDAGNQVAKLNLPVGTHPQSLASIRSIRIDNQPPPAPAPPMAPATVNTNSIPYSWDPATDNDPSGIASYEIQVFDGGIVVATQTVFTTFYEFTGGVNGKSYYAKVRAFDRAGNASAFSLRGTDARVELPPALTLGLNMPVLYRGQGAIAKGTVTRDSSVGQATVNLALTDASSSISIPPNVTLSEGMTYADFPIAVSATSDVAIQGTKFATIQATCSGCQSSKIGFQIADRRRIYFGTASKANDLWDAGSGHGWTGPLASRICNLSFGGTCYDQSFTPSTFQASAEAGQIFEVNARIGHYTGQIYSAAGTLIVSGSSLQSTMLVYFQGDPLNGFTRTVKATPNINYERDYSFRNSVVADSTGLRVTYQKTSANYAWAAPDIEIGSQPAYVTLKNSPRVDPSILEVQLFLTEEAVASSVNTSTVSIVGPNGPINSGVTITANDPDGNGYAGSYSITISGDLPLMTNYLFKLSRDILPRSGVASFDFNGNGNLADSDDEITLNLADTLRFDFKLLPYVATGLERGFTIVKDSTIASAINWGWTVALQRQEMLALDSLNSLRRDWVYARSYSSPSFFNVKVLPNRKYKARVYIGHPTLALSKSAVIAVTGATQAINPGVTLGTVAIGNYYFDKTLNKYVVPPLAAGVYDTTVITGVSDANGLFQVSMASNGLSQPFWYAAGMDIWDATSPDPGLNY